MHTQQGTRWQAIPTPADRLFFPSVAFADGATEGWVSLIVWGQPEEPACLITFTNVDMCAGYSEALYWTRAIETSRPQGLLSEVVPSQLLSTSLQEGQRHYVVCGAQMVCEVMATEVVVTEFPNEQAARAQLASELVR